MIKLKIIITTVCILLLTGCISKKERINMNEVYRKKLYEHFYGIIENIGNDNYQAVIYNENNNEIICMKPLYKNNPGFQSKSIDYCIYGNIKYDEYSFVIGNIYNNQVKSLDFDAFTNISVDNYEDYYFFFIIIPSKEIKKEYTLYGDNKDIIEKFCID